MLMMMFLLQSYFKMMLTITIFLLLSFLGLGNIADMNVDYDAINDVQIAVSSD